MIFTDYTKCSHCGYEFKLYDAITWTTHGDVTCIQCRDEYESTIKSKLSMKRVNEGKGVYAVAEGF